MFENPRRGRQAWNFTTNVPKILDLKSSSEQTFSENWRWVSLEVFMQRLCNFVGWTAKAGADNLRILGIMLSIRPIRFIALDIIQESFNIWDMSWLKSRDVMEETLGWVKKSSCFKGLFHDSTHVWAVTIADCF